METAHVDQNSFWHKMMPDLEVNRYGVISIVLLIVGCMGGLTVGLGAIDHTWQLIAVVIPTMLTLSLLLAVAPMKQIMNSMLIAVVIDVVIMLLNFFS
jgi:hypothetical protein